MSPAWPMPQPAGLQAVPFDVLPSLEAVNLAIEILEAQVSVAVAMERVAELFAAQPRVDTVAAALTTFGPEDRRGWTSLGERAWVREWRDPDSPCQVLPSGDAGPEAALTMPYMSQYLRYEVVVIPDADGLPPEGEQDRREMASCGARALIAGAQVAEGEMFGSLSIGSAEGGPWPESLVADMRVLNAALTSRMAAEQSRRAMAEAIAVGEQARATQQQFFSTLGHELRTPIAAIIGLAEVLADEARDHDDVAAETVGRDAGVILRAGEQLLAIVEDLLSTGRTLGAEEARMDQDVAAAVEDVIHWHRTPARAKEVTVTSTVPPGLRVHARAAGLRQVLTNLIGNAIVHNRPGGSVEVSAEPSYAEARDARVRISVRDTGPGLEPPELERVFEPFVRFAGTEVRGTGLGLPLARTIAERDGGLVGGESVPGQGSVFWVDLPAEG